VPETEGLLSLPNGRALAWVEGGVPDGYPVFGLHGTPGCRYNRMLDESAYSQAGNRYITTDRAGYGLSTRNRGRTVATEVADVLAVADFLSIDRFSVVGGSGGGPHALACAALLADRVDFHCVSVRETHAGGSYYGITYFDRDNNNHFIPGRESILLNDDIGNSRDHAITACQELGHVLGLEHQYDVLTSCMHSPHDASEATTPNSTDYSRLSSLYNH